MRRTVAIYVVLSIWLAAIIALAVGVNLYLPFHYCTRAVFYAIVIGVCFSIVAIVWPWASVTERIMGGLLIFYVALAGHTDQFSRADFVDEAFISVMWVIPAAVGCLALPRRRMWFAGIGCWFVLFACVVALTATYAGGGYRGIGLFMYWLS